MHVRRFHDVLHRRATCGVCVKSVWCFFNTVIADLSAPISSSNTSFFLRRTHAASCATRWLRPRIVGCWRCRSARSSFLCRASVSSFDHTCEIRLSLFPLSIADGVSRTLHQSHSRNATPGGPRNVESFARQGLCLGGWTALRSAGHLATMDGRNVQHHMH